MGTLIDDAREAAASLAGMGHLHIAGVIRTLADAHDVLRVGLANRSRCHEEALGLLETIRRIPEPEGWAFKSVIKSLRAWRVARGEGPLVLTSGDIDHLEIWGSDLLEGHHQAIECLTRRIP